MTEESIRRKKFAYIHMSFLNAYSLNDFRPENKKVIDGMYNCDSVLGKFDGSRSAYERKLRGSDCAPKIQAKYNEKREWINRCYNDPMKQNKHYVKTWLKEIYTLARNGVYSQDLMKPISQTVPSRTVCDKLSVRTYYNFTGYGFKISKSELSHSFEPKDRANPDGCGLCSIYVDTPAPK